jgi:hypothetical protein
LLRYLVWRMTLAFNSMSFDSGIITLLIDVYMSQQSAKCIVYNCFLPTVIQNLKRCSSKNKHLYLNCSSKNVPPINLVNMVNRHYILSGYATVKCATWWFYQHEGRSDDKRPCRTLHCCINSLYNF